MPLYKRKDSEFWWADIIVPGHPRLRRSTETADRVEAQRVHDEIRAGLWSKPKGSKRTWGEAVALWTDAADRAESDLQSLAKFAAHYPDRSLDQVTAESLMGALAFCRTFATFNRYCTRLTAILNLAKKHKWLAEIPELVKKSTKRAKPREWITHEEWARLLPELPEHMQRMATFALETGLRQANVLNLCWREVDVDRKLLWVEGMFTKAGDPLSIPLSDAALGVLDCVAEDHEDFVFVYRGSTVSEVKTAWQAACVRAGLGKYVKTDKGRGYEGFTWHGLRHTFATWHVQAGTPLEVLQMLGGWADLRMVMQYAHHAPSFVAGYANNKAKKESVR